MFKKLLLILIILPFYSGTAFSQKQETLLAQADSLFALQHFTQSFELYDSVYQIEEQASPAMLLKMAYIKEGLHDITKAQCYLNEYYLATKNEQALQKMEDLASANDLSGYEHDDITFFFSLYYQNYNWLVISVVTVCIILFTLILYQKKRYNRTPWLNIFFLFTLLIGLFVLVNFGRDYNRGIIIQDNAYIMAAPSSGADLVDVISKGHKVVVQGEKDVWYKIEWDGQDAYIKARNIKLLTIW